MKQHMMIREAVERNFQKTDEEIARLVALVERVEALTIKQGHELEEARAEIARLRAKYEPDGEGAR